MAQATPLYFAGAKWQEPGGGYRLDAFVIGFDPAARPFVADDIERQGAVLGAPDTMLVDNATRSIFGPLAAGTRILLERPQRDDRRHVYARDRVSRDRRRA